MEDGDYMRKKCPWKYLEERSMEAGAKKHNELLHN
jgi:hypothetical protein